MSHEISLLYKPALPEVLDRLRRLYSRQAPDGIFASFEIPSAALDGFQERYAAAFCDYPDPRERARFWDRLLAERAALEDDSVPSAYLSELDQGLYGGLLGGDVRFLAHPENGWISSMVPPLLDSWLEFGRLELREDNIWLDRYRRQLEIFAAEARGRFGISHFILINGLNFVFELIGATETYLSLSQDPEMVRRAIDLAHTVNLRVQRMFFDAVPLLEGGTSSNMVQWIPGRVISESVDPFHMTSLKDFEAWGRGPVERIFGEFDGGVLHLHGNERHLIESAASLRGLKAVFLGNDKGYPPVYDVLDGLRQRSGDLPLVIEIPMARFVDGLERRTLAGGVFYRVKGETEVAEANRLMEEVRSYRR